jgi:cysteine-rich repeat protein
MIEQGFYCPSTGGICKSVCGDNVQASTEQCDDGNNNNGDGCDWNCKIEQGYFCTPPTQVGPYTGATFQMICAACDSVNSFCKVCASTTTCQTCKTGRFLAETTCVATCTGGTYQDLANGLCQS